MKSVVFCNVFLHTKASGNPAASDCRKSHILTGRRVTPYSVGRCPKDRGYGHPLGAPSPTDGYFTYYECRGELCVKSNMVNTWCKDMVYN